MPNSKCRRYDSIREPASQETAGEKERRLNSKAFSLVYKCIFLTCKLSLELALYLKKEKDIIQYATPITETYKTNQREKNSYTL